MENLQKKDFWTIVFSLISIIFAVLVLYIPEQRIILLTFLVLSILFAIFFSYVNKIKENEKMLKTIKEKLEENSKNLIEKFNYLKEVYNLKVEVEMLKRKNKKAQAVDLISLLKILVAIILIYVIITTIKNLF